MKPIATAIHAPADLPADYDLRQACCNTVTEIPCMQDPLAIIGIVSILLPFIILGIAIATGVIDVNAGRA